MQLELIKNINEYRSSIDFFENEYYNIHDYYTTNISEKIQATSFKQCCILSFIVKTYDIRKILDTGSGISTYFIRKEVNGKNVFTFETDLNWLNKTKQFLIDNNTNTDNIFLWENVEHENIGEFDFVYHDMGSIDIRINTLDNIVNRLSDKGVIMLDDLHFDVALHPNLQPKYHLKSYIDRYFNMKYWEFVDIKDLSIDEYGRFAGIFIKK